MKMVIYILKENIFMAHTVEKFMIAMVNQNLKENLIEDKFTEEKKNIMKWECKI